MKAIVFGGSGFLGSNVVDALTESGHEVFIFDIRKSNYIQSNQKMIVGDILDEKLVNDSIINNKIDIIYNLAGMANIDECSHRPIDTVKYNILGNTIILEAARKVKIKRFLFASSVYVFSDAGYFYRSSKQSCELFIENYNKLFGLPYTILRYGSLYGNRADENNSIYKYIKSALLEGKIIYHGTGEENREYIHVKDAAVLSVKVLEKEFENQHVLLTGNESMRYKDLLEMISEILKNKVDVIYKEQEGDTHYKISPYTFNPKIGKKIVNNPHLDLGQGLLDCIREVYEKIHKEKQAKMGLLVENKDN